ncbi:MAG: tRNA dihydrouridine synthase DusB [Tenericutes bacterium]|jgi:tRNA-dihydrouridine synthase B|nr:tRNA dihydrouridine synthase DusB [Mycoplasmatota bacterium]
MKWKIGNVVIENQIVLAPMAGIGNSSFRRIIKEMGCGLIFAEMVNDKALFYKNKKTIDMLYATNFERPIVQQIFGSDEESFIKAAEFIYNYMKPDIIDINIGCPVPKVAIKAQAGAALLKDVNKIEKIVRAVIQTVPIPVTVKIRSGWDFKNINAIEVAKAVEKAGASAITVHPRTRSQGYSGIADWSIIKEVKANVKIPVIGNGDIVDIFSAKAILDETGCDAIMIGRGVLGNPWLIRDIIAYLKEGTILPKVSDIEKINMIFKHMTYLSEQKSEKITVLEMRNHIAWYLKGLKKANEIKMKVYQEKTINGIMNILNDYKKELEEKQ